MLLPFLAERNNQRARLRHKLEQLQLSKHTLQGEHQRAKCAIEHMEKREAGISAVMEKLSSEEAHAATSVTAGQALLQSVRDEATIVQEKASFELFLHNTSYKSSCSFTAWHTPSYIYSVRELPDSVRLSELHHEERVRQSPEELGVGPRVAAQPAGTMRRGWVTCHFLFTM